MPSDDSSFVDGKNLTSDEWLKLALAAKTFKKLTIVDYQFPTDKHAEEYGKTIQSRSEQDIKTLLRNFLITTGTYGNDQIRLEY